MRRFADSMAWGEDRGFAIGAAVDARMAFVRRTYAHLFAELAAVALLVYVAIQTPALQDLASGLMGSFWIYLAVVFGISLVTRRMLEGRTSLAIQYVAAGIWVFFLGLLVTPLAVFVQKTTGSYALLGQAAVLTGCVFGGITAYVFTTKKDFSFLRGALSALSMLGIGIAIVSYFLGGFGAGMSLVYSVGWAILLSGWVLYDTSKVLHRRAVDQHVAASVDLLVDFVYLFIYIARILLGSRR